MKHRLIGIGEVLWDMLPQGRQMGGAPANFACHAAALGAEAHVLSRVGNDEPGRSIISRLALLDVATNAIQIDPQFPTGTVDVELAPDGQPRFTILQNVAWDHIADEASGRQLVLDADAVCFGTLAQRNSVSRESIRSLLKSLPTDKLRIFDVNLRQDFYSPEIIEVSLNLANILKVNETELPILAELFHLAGDEQKQLTALAERFALQVVAYTRGSAGSLLYAAPHWSHHPSIPVTVADTIGAGDSFTAALAMGLLEGWPLSEVHHRAASIAAYVCSQPGATPALPEDLRAAYLAIDD